MILQRIPLVWRLQQRIVKRIGVLRLWQHADDAARYAVSLDNRTYHQFFEIPAERVEAWHREFRHPREYR